MMKRRILAVLLAAAMAGTLLAGCSSGSGSSEDAKEEKTEEQAEKQEEDQADAGVKEEPEEQKKVFVTPEWVQGVIDGKEEESGNYMILEVS